jgi:hypothetical protein
MQDVSNRVLHFGILVITGLILGLYGTYVPAARVRPVQKKPYVFSIDIAQYALHQGDARSANLVSGRKFNYL